MSYSATLAVSRALRILSEWVAADSARTASVARFLRSRLVDYLWSGERRPWLRNWCGALAASCVEHGGVALRPGERRGARKLTRAVASRGSWAISPVEASAMRDRRDAEVLGRAALQVGRVAPGDLVCWYRGLPRTWLAHVAIVVEVSPSGAWLDVVEGNVGGAVRRSRLPAGEWLGRLSGLYGVARPA